jgi:hypothetical protein
MIDPTRTPALCPTLCRTSRAQIRVSARRPLAPASAAFQTRWQEWQAGATQVQQAMDSMGIFLDEAARTYEETEEALRAAAGR